MSDAVLPHSRYNSTPCHRFCCTIRTSLLARTIHHDCTMHTMNRAYRGPAREELCGCARGPEECSGRKRVDGPVQGRTGKSRIDSVDLIRGGVVHMTSW